MLNEVLPPARAGCSDATSRAEHGQHLLAATGALLASSIDAGETMTAVADLVVPDFADWFVLHLLDDDDLLHPAMTRHADPDKRALAEEYHRRWPLDRAHEGAVGQVARSGQSVLAAHIADDMLRAVARDAEHLDVIRALGMRSVIIVPLAARDRCLGAMTLVAVEPRRAYDEEDRALAEELARRDLARAMHGDLTVTSTLGVGSTFTLALPCRAAAELDERASTSEGTI